MDDAISLSGIVKTFGSTRALDGLDLTVRTGEVHGFLGPNGAGKTTTLKMLSGLIYPTSGTARMRTSNSCGGDGRGQQCGLFTPT